MYFLHVLGEKSIFAVKSLFENDSFCLGYGENHHKLYTRENKKGLKSQVYYPSASHRAVINLYLEYSLLFSPCTVIIHINIILSDIRVLTFLLNLLVTVQ